LQVGVVQLAAGLGEPVENARGTLTPDSLGLRTAPNQHAYVDNPPAWIDPLGLASYKVVHENDAGRFGDRNPGVPGDGLTPHNMPRAAAIYTSRDDGGAIAMTHADQTFTRTCGSKGAVTQAAEAGLPQNQRISRQRPSARPGPRRRGDRAAQKLLEAIPSPVIDEEAHARFAGFGPDDCFDLGLNTPALGRDGARREERTTPP
jgi:hypothetical protein